MVITKKERDKKGHREGKRREWTGTGETGEREDREKEEGGENRATNETNETRKKQPS